MIRHSSSFFLSLIIHTSIAFALFFVWKNIPPLEKEIEKKIPLKLSCIVEPKPKPKPKPIIKPKKIIKPIPPKPKPIPKKPKKKPKPKPKVKKKVIPKKTIPKKVIPIVKDIIKPQEPIIVEKKTKKVEIIEEKIEITTEVHQESSHDKKIRLEKDYLDENIQQISKLLQENLYYPRSARKRGITGEVIVKFKLSTNGIANSIEIISTNSDILSRAAIKTIENLSGKFPKPKEELILHVPINYKLRR